jgi:hypothetical protein
MTAIVGSSNGIAAVSYLDTQIEQLMMSVQCSRVGALDTQLATELGGMQNNNAKVEKLNQLLTTLNNASAAFAGDAKSDTQMFGVTNAPGLCTDVRDAAANAGIKDLGMNTDSNGFGGSVTKGQIDAKIQEVKSQIDSLSNVGQMTMLRVQSLNGKRGESFDTMSSFMKKCADSRASILSTWR